MDIRTISNFSHPMNILFGLRPLSTFKSFSYADGDREMPRLQSELWVSEEAD